MSDTIATVDADTGRLVAQPSAWLVRYGDRLQHRALFLERTAAERSAVSLRGQLVALYVGPMP